MKYDGQQAGCYERDQAGASIPGEHPLSANADVVAHDPRIRKQQIVTAEHSDAAHKDDASIFADRHRGSAYRHNTGLRREEVAELADIGVDWYIRLEQGRAVRPSATTVDALSRILQINSTERAHFEALARHDGRSGFSQEIVPGPVLRLLNRLDHPAYVTGRRWDVLAWNRAAREMVTDFDRVSEEDRNILVWMLTTRDARRVFGAGWSDEAKRMLAVFRATHDLWASDPAFVALVKRLREGSSEFVEWWDTHDIRDTTAGRKTLHHPTKGAQLFEYVSFQSNDDRSLKLSFYTRLSESP